MKFIVWIVYYNSHCQVPTLIEQEKCTKLQIQEVNSINEAFLQTLKSISN